VNIFGPSEAESQLQAAYELAVELEANPLTGDIREALDSLAQGDRRYASEILEVIIDKIERVAEETLTAEGQDLLVAIMGYVLNAREAI